MFDSKILADTLAAYGTSGDTHSARLVTLASMLASNEAATIDDVVHAVKYAAAQSELGVSFDTFNAAVDRAADRVQGYSASTFARYSMVLQWLAPALANDESMPELLNAGAFTVEALSALVQLASGKVATRKVAGDSVAGAIGKRDSAAIVATYRRLLAAKSAKAKATQARAKSSKTTTAGESSPGDNSPSVTREAVIESLDTFALVKILSARIAANSDNLTAKQFEELADELAGIAAMLEA